MTTASDLANQAATQASGLANQAATQASALANSDTAKNLSAQATAMATTLGTQASQFAGQAHAQAHAMAPGFVPAPGVDTTDDLEPGDKGDRAKFEKLFSERPAPSELKDKGILKGVQSLLSPSLTRSTETMATVRVVRSGLTCQAIQVTLLPARERTCKNQCLRYVTPDIFSSRRVFCLRDRTSWTKISLNDRPRMTWSRKASSSVRLFLTDWFSKLMPGAAGEEYS